MAEFVREKITTRTESQPLVEMQVRETATNSQTVNHLIYFALGIIESLLAFRLVLKITGASNASAFVDFIYGITGLFILPFEGIFRRAVADGIETTAVLEPATIVAMVVYALLAIGIIKLIEIFSGEKGQV